MFIRGRVHGVSFRVSVARRAQSSGLTGWVRNRFDGSVEVMAEGSPTALSSLRVFCADGPRGAHVRDLEVHDETETGEFVAFSVRPDA